MTRAELFLNVIQLPWRLRNFLLNRIFSALYGARIRIIWSEAKIQGLANIHFGQHFQAGRGLWLQAIAEGRLTIGDNVNVSDWVHIGAMSNVRIGNGCLMGSKVLITDHNHGSVADLRLHTPQAPNTRPLHSKGPVVLEDNVWLGDAVVVLPGVSIGRNAIVGANSVVSCDIPQNTVWAGVPAKQIWPTQV